MQAVARMFCAGRYLGETTVAMTSRTALFWAFLTFAAAPVSAAKPVGAALMCLRTLPVPKDLADVVASAGFASPDRLRLSDARRVDDMVAACEADRTRHDGYARYLRAHLMALVQSVSIEAEGITPSVVDGVLARRRAELMAGGEASDAMLDAINTALIRSGVKVENIGDEGWYQLGGYIASHSAMAATEMNLRR